MGLRIKHTLLAAVLVAACLLVGCQPADGGDSSEPEVVGGSTRREEVASGELQFARPADDAVFAVIETSRGTVKVVLYPQEAPLAVENFCTLAQWGYYDGAEFHRVIADFAVQGGDGTGRGNSGHSIWGESFDTEYSDALYHFSGALCMAAADGEVGSHLSQFYIVATPQGNLSDAALARLTAAGLRDSVVEAYRQAGGAPYLDNTDTVFGQVYNGMDVVDRIAAVPTDEADRPKTPVTIERITILDY